MCSRHSANRGQGLLDSSGLEIQGAGLVLLVILFSLHLLWPVYQISVYLSNASNLSPVWPDVSGTLLCHGDQEYPLLGSQDG